LGFSSAKVRCGVSDTPTSQKHPGERGNSGKLGSCCWKRASLTGERGKETTKEKCLKGMEKIPKKNRRALQGK